MSNKTIPANGGCLARIRGWAQDASGAAARVAEYIMNEPQNAQSMSIDELAKQCNTSASTVSRFCTSVGYGGYKEFQLDLAAALALMGSETLDDFDEKAPPEVVARRVFECNIQSLRDTMKMLDKASFVEVARLIHRAPKTVFLGIGGSGLVAREAKQRFISLGLTAMAAEDPYIQIFLTANLKKSDVVMAISHTGQTAPVIEGVVAARKKGAHTVALTNYPRSPLALAAEYTLVTAFREHRINAAVSSSRIAQFCIIDALYFLVAGWCSTEARKLADQAEQRVQEMLRGR